MNVLVTGGAGFVGSVCTEQLLSAGNCVVVLDDLTSGHREAVPSKACFVEGDYGDARMIGQIVRQNGIEAVMHFAGETLVGKSMSDPRAYFVTNVKKGIDFLNALTDEGVNRIIFSSTAAVYGEPECNLITETHRKEPMNAYGESKRMFENLNWYRRAYGLEYIAVRYFNAAGASKNCGEDHYPETHVIPLLLQSVGSSDRTFTLFGDDYHTADGTCIRDYVHVVDIAQAHLLALDALRSGRWGEYNLGSGTGFSVKEVLRAVEEVTGHSVSYNIGPRRPGDPAILVASNEKARRELNWDPKHSTLRDIVESAWFWKQQHPDGYVANFQTVRPVQESVSRAAEHEASST